MKRLSGRASERVANGEKYYKIKIIQAEGKRLLKGWQKDELTGW